MKIVIIEDEPLAARRMEKLIAQLDEPHEIVAMLDSVESGMTWFENPVDFDLIMADIQLGDGLSLDFLSKVGNKPIIFTTAYNHYALEAFKLLSVAYLLKPVGLEDLQDALHKLNQLQQGRGGPANVQINLQQIKELLQQGSHKHPTRLVIRYGPHIKAIPYEEIACFYVEERACMVLTFDKRQLAADYNLEQLEGMVNAAHFFRINRKVMVNIKAIKNMQAYSRSRVVLTLEPEVKTDLVVSTERSPAFKKWLEG
jgi:two-component system response regulator LytT